MLLRMATPTRAKKRLGRFLAELRVAAGRSLLEPAAELKTSDSTVSRYESGQVMPVWSTVLTLVNYYGATDDQRARANQLWDDAKLDTPPIRLPAGTPKSFRQLINAEREAETEWAIELSIVPGLLQTKQYARALFVASHQYANPASSQDDVINAKLSRQHRLTASDPLELHAILDEGAIRREVGGPEVMHEQLEHLLTMGARSNVTIQVVPYGVGAYGTMSGPCAIVGYGEPDDTPGVYLEYPAGGAWVENEQDVERFTAMFADVSELALSPQDSSEMIKRQLREQKKA